MTGLSRRRFLVGLVTGIGAGTVGAAAWLNRGGDIGYPSAGTEPAVTMAPSSTTTSAPGTTATTATMATSSTTAPAGVIPVICSSAWGAEPRTGEYVEHRIAQITVHHTAMLLEDNAAAPGRLRRHQAYHQSLGWPDLAYHFMVDASGNVYEGRPVVAAGDTATEYDPTGHLLVCCEGNFDEQPIPPAQYDALVQLLAWGCGEFGIEPGTVAGHRDHAATTCPGDDLYSHLESGALADAVGAHTGEKLRIESLCGESGRAVVGAIETGRLDGRNQSRVPDV